MVCSACRFDSIRALRMIENIHSKLYEDDSKDNVGVIGCKSKTGNSKNMKQGEGNMERCPICGSSFREAERICSACGYDASADWTRYPTLTQGRKMPHRQNIMPAKKKLDDYCFQSGQENSTRQDPNAWISFGNSASVNTSAQSGKQLEIPEQKNERNYDSCCNLEELEERRKSSLVVGKGVCGTSAKWTLYIDGALWISGYGAMKDYNVFGALITNMPWKKFRNEIISVVIDEGITAVGGCAFSGCTKLNRVWMANTVQKLHCFAFSDCRNLKDVHMSSGLRVIGPSAFLNCESLINIRLPQTLQAIEGYAFQDDISLKHIDIPLGVTSIGWGAFMGCALESVELPGKIEKLENCVFEGCTKLRNISLPNGIKSIGWNTFKDCSALKKIVIPANVNKIKSFTFENCTALRIIVLQGENCKIENGAFRNCPANIYWE